VQAGVCRRIEQEQPGTIFVCTELGADRSTIIAESEDDLSVGSDVELCTHLATGVDELKRLGSYHSRYGLSLRGAAVQEHGDRERDPDGNDDNGRLPNLHDTSSVR